MFLDEARLAARIRHPNVVSTLDVVATEGELFVVMEYVPGESLARLLRAVRTANEMVPVPIAATIMVGVLHGLHAAHEARDERGDPLRIVHRDVSPHNILVGTDGDAHVIDFGIAKARGRMQVTRQGQIKGKLSYMPAEQLIGQGLDHRADIFAASIVLWEALTGQRLFQGSRRRGRVREGSPRQGGPSEPAREGPQPGDRRHRAAGARARPDPALRDGARDGPRHRGGDPAGAALACRALGRGTRRRLARRAHRADRGDRAARRRRRGRDVLGADDHRGRDAPARQSSRTTCVVTGARSTALSRMDRTSPTQPLGGRPCRHDRPDGGRPAGGLPRAKDRGRRVERAAPGPPRRVVLALSRSSSRLPRRMAAVVALRSPGVTATRRAHQPATSAARVSPVDTHTAAPARLLGRIAGLERLASRCPRRRRSRRRRQRASQAAIPADGAKNADGAPEGLPSHRRRARDPALLAARRRPGDVDHGEAAGRAARRTGHRRTRQAAIRRSTSMRTGRRDTSDIARTSEGSLVDGSIDALLVGRRPIAIALSALARVDGLVDAGARTPSKPLPPRPPPTRPRSASARQNGRSRSFARRSCARRARCSRSARRDACPRVARTDCREWLAEATDAQPSIVIAAHEVRGDEPRARRRRRARGHRRRARRGQGRRDPDRHRPGAPPAPPGARGRRPHRPGHRHPRGRKGPRRRRLLARRGRGGPHAARSAAASSCRERSASSRLGLGTYFESLRALAAPRSRHVVQADGDVHPVPGRIRRGPRCASATWRSAAASFSSRRRRGPLSDATRDRGAPRTGRERVDRQRFPAASLPAPEGRL